MLLLGGCTSFGTAHDAFINMMNTYIDQKKTINELEYDPKYPHGYYIANRDYLTSIETVRNNTLRYNYSRPNLWGTYCHYYLDVNKTTNIVLAWGFNVAKGDPKKTCGKSG